LLVVVACVPLVVVVTEPVDADATLGLTVPLVVPVVPLDVVAVVVDVIVPLTVPVSVLPTVVVVCAGADVPEIVCVAPAEIVLGEVPAVVLVLELAVSAGADVVVVLALAVSAGADVVVVLALELVVSPADGVGALVVDPAGSDAAEKNWNSGVRTAGAVVSVVSGVVAVGSAAVASGVVVAGGVASVEGAGAGVPEVSCSSTGVPTSSSTTGAFANGSFGFAGLVELLGGTIVCTSLTTGSLWRTSLRATCVGADA
jgi:hypothetical protein